MMHKQQKKTIAVTLPNVVIEQMIVVKSGYSWIRNLTMENLLGIQKDLIIFEMLESSKIMSLYVVYFLSHYSEIKSIQHLTQRSEETNLVIDLIYLQLRMLYVYPFML